MSIPTKTQQELDMLDKREERLRLNQLTKPLDWLILASHYEELLQTYLLSQPPQPEEVNRIRKIIESIYELATTAELETPVSPLFRDEEDTPPKTEQGGTIQNIKHQNPTYQKTAKLIA